MPDATKPQVTDWITANIDDIKLAVPEYSSWRCEVFGGTYWSPLKGQEPNAFHRLMQRLILGFRWTRP